LLGQSDQKATDGVRGPPAETTGREYYRIMGIRRNNKRENVPHPEEQGRAKKTVSGSCGGMM